MLIISAFATLLLTAVLGYLSKFKTKNATDFISAGGDVRVFGSTGALMGSIIGGASTVGTTQLAYTRGIAAMWFILGICTASILLSFFYTKVIKAQNVLTLPQILESTFGKKASIVASLLLSIGMLVHINGQVIACNSLFSTVFDWRGLLITGFVILLLMSYVIFGGFWGGTLIGSLKMILLYSTSLIAGYYVLFKLDGKHVITSSLTDFFWYNPFNNGFFSDFGSYLSTVVGVLSTQNYFQSIMASKNLKVAKTSGFLTAVLVFPIGIVCTLIGMFMRVQHPNILPATAFPKFIVTYLPAPLAGVTLATILISSLATGAGLTLGVSTIFAKDLYKSWLCVKATDGQQLKFMRWVILGIGLITFIVTTLLADAIILNFGFASMLLRAGPIFVPLVMTLYFPKHLTPTVGMVAIVGGPSASILWMLLGLPMQSAIFVGLVTSLLIFVVHRRLLRYRF